MDRLINRHFGKQIEEADDLTCYHDAREYLRKDHQLAVADDASLHPDYWLFRNGIFDVREKQMTENKGQFFVRNVLQCDYNPSASCPKFEQFVTSVAGGDDGLINLIWEAIGYLLSNDCSGKVFFVCVGPKDTGKSLFARVLARIVGQDAVSYLSAGDFGGRFDMAELRGKHLNICMDLPDKSLSVGAVGRIKALTGNDTIRSDVKFKTPVRYKPTARLLFGTNSGVRTEAFDPAFLERMLVLPFSYAVPKSKQNFLLEEELIAEAAGICQKAMSYYLKVADSGYHFTRIDWADDDQFVTDYRIVIEDFVKQTCEVTGRDDDRIASSELYHHFKDFCVEKTLQPLELNKFSRMVKEFFGDEVEKKKIRIGSRTVQGYQGVRFYNKAGM